MFAIAPRSTTETIPPARAVFSVGGEEIHTVNVPGRSTPIPTDISEAEASLDRSANVLIPGDLIRPGLEMVVDIDPDGTLDPDLGVSRRIPESGRMAVAVRTMPTFDLTVVPFVWENGPDSTAVRMAEAMAADPEGHRLLWETHDLLPVGDIAVSAHDPVLTSTNSGDDLLEQVGVIRALEGGSGYYMATLSGEATGPWGVAYIPGRTSYVRLGTGTGLPAEGLTVAHELGHNLSLWHAPCGTRATLDAGYPHEDGSIGSWGIDWRSGSHVLVPPTVSDMMSYCVPAHVGDYHFSKALRYRLISELATATTSVLLVWGGIDADGEPFLNPAFAVDAPVSLPHSGGPHRIVGRGSDGAILFSLDFDMMQMADWDGRSGFVFAIPSRPEWAGALNAIELSGPGGSVTIDQTTDRPAVILRDPESGQVRGILMDRIPSMVADQVGPGNSRTLPNLEILFSRGIPDWSGRR